MVSTRANLSAGPRLAPPDPSAGPDRSRSRNRLIIGAVAAAVVLGAGLALLGKVGMREPGEEDRVAAATPKGEGVRPASTDQALTFAPPAAREPYRPVNREAIQRAYGQVGAVYAAQGVSGLARGGIECFRSLEQAPTYAALDFCLAFDAIAAAVNQRLSGAAPPPSDSWFGQAAERDLQVAQAVMGAEGDAAARLVDIRRLAVEVAREGGPVVQASAPAAPAAPAAPQIAPAVVAPQPAVQARPAPPAVVESPQPARQASAAPVRPRPAATADAAAPPAEARAPVRAPAARANARPSFNCRYARTRSERLVCGDPGLAALDRGLNAAYEDAIAAGADRRTLRAEQDRWLSTREAAARDPDAVAEVYRRRIEELRDLR